MWIRYVVYVIGVIALVVPLFYTNDRLEGAATRADLLSLFGMLVMVLVMMLDPLEWWKR